MEEGQLQFKVGELVGKMEELIKGIDSLCLKCEKVTTRVDEHDKMINRGLGVIFALSALFTFLWDFLKQFFSK